MMMMMMGGSRPGRWKGRRTKGFWDGAGEGDALGDVCLEALVCADACLVCRSANAGREALEETGELGGRVSDEWRLVMVMVRRSYSAGRRLWRARLLCRCGRPSQTQAQQEREAEEGHVGEQSRAEQSRAEQSRGRLRRPRGRLEAGIGLDLWLGGGFVHGAMTGRPGLLIVKYRRDDDG